MVAPVVGPTYVTQGGTGSGIKRYSFQAYYRQTKPYDLVLPYIRTISEGVQRGADVNVHARSVISGGGDFTNAIGSYQPWSHLENACYDKLKDKISDRASLGVFLAEINQSLSMITTRALQIAKFAKQVRALRFGDAARTLRMASVPKGVSVHKSFSNNFLEYWFGWSPMIGDIYSAIDVLQSPINDVHVTASVSAPEREYNVMTPVFYTNPLVWYPNYNVYRYWHKHIGKQQVKMGTSVVVNNPNLWLANQLGLVNPAVVAYELIPFSFVANWFFNVEQFLSSGTDFYGLTLKGEWTTRRYRGTVDHYQEARYRWLEGTPSREVNGGGIFIDWHGKVVSISRNAGLTKPTFVARPWKPWKWQRTASAVSLLLQRL